MPEKKVDSGHLYQIFAYIAFEDQADGAAREAARCGRQLGAALVAGMRAASQNAGWMLGEEPGRAMLCMGEDGEVT